MATRFGTVSVPSAPQRVVALGWGDAETLYALGVQPVGTSDWLGFGGDGVGPWAKSLVRAKPQQLGTTTPNFEKIAALRPDLILNTRSDNSKATYDTLSKIAPTVSAPSGAIPYGISWMQQTMTIAKAVGQEAKGAQLVTRTQARIKALAAAHPTLAGKTYAVGALFGTDQWGAYVKGDIRADFLSSLGMQNAPAVKALKTTSFYANVSPENLQVFDADLTLMFPIGPNTAALKKNPTLNNLASAKAGHLLILDADSAQAFSDGSVLALEYVIDTVAPKIIQAAAG